MKRFIFAERPVVAAAIRLIKPEFESAEVVGRAGSDFALTRLEPGDHVAGNVDVPSLARITAAGATYFGFGVSASHERLKAEEPTAEQLVSASFKGRLQEVVASRDDAARLPKMVDVFSNQLTAQICHFLHEAGVETAVVDEVHPSQAEVVEGLRRAGMRVQVEGKAGMGRLGRSPNWRGRTVVGHMMPRHATEYCTAGAQYFHFELPGRPAHKHNHAWTLDECRDFGATFEKYDVWRWGKSIRLFDQGADEINL